MQEQDGLTTEQLLPLGYTLQPDGRLRRRRRLYKAQCCQCKRWFQRLKGDRCWGCHERSTIAHRREAVDNDKRRSRTFRSA